MSVTMPAGFTLRAPTHDDLPAIHAVAAACQIAAYSSPDPAMLDTVEITWGKPGFDRGRDAWVVEASNGRLAGYAHAGPPDRTHTYAHAWVHPDFSGRGIGMRLLALTEQRTRERGAPPGAGAQWTLEQWIEATNHAARTLLASAGYHEVRHIWGMRIALDAPPAPAVWPAGVTVRACLSEDDFHRAYLASQDAFQDHWHFEPQTYDQFASSLIAVAAFDPTLWFLAVEGDEVAGVALGEVLSDRRGWINDVAVRRSWRGRGIGLALLRHAFGAFYRRGVREVGLGVDSQNPTGATRLYERAGMLVERQYDVYEKALGARAALRPGRESERVR